jgi:hypothetical protein
MFHFEKTNIEKMMPVFSLLAHPHVASLCDTWRAGRPLPMNFLAPQRATYHVRSEVLSLCEDLPFSNNFDNPREQQEP